MTHGIMGRMRALTAGPRSRRRIDRGLLLASLGIAVGLVAIAYAFLSASDTSEIDLPDGIEQLSPVPGAPQALSQTQVIADLGEGYYGELTIDGTALETVRLDELAEVEPGAQVDDALLLPGAVYEPGNDTLTFTPSEASDIERFESGRHQVTLVYWPLEEGRSSARTYVWYFSTV